ncbi:rhodanese-like domain-containing protein [uncultured Sneathiella sp.]|uniref:rhodanese-like domain-containing protein n=1 Tax=uncultured Sneathiella sp. TaxID=879315 RepID=UPI0030DC2511|tara:strand:- start:3198 stop:3653 length:456 start_codon:yes stop_codon:yes gene_type:complete
MNAKQTIKNKSHFRLVLAGVLLAVVSSALIAMTLVQADDSYKEFGYRMITPLETEALLKQQPDVVVLDIRTPEEFNAGHIAGAVNIDYFAADFADRIAGLDPAKTYVLHCKSGGRSDRSLPLMRANNITNVHHLEAGFDGWKAAGLPIARS